MIDQLQPSIKAEVLDFLGSQRVWPLTSLFSVSVEKTQLYLVLVLKLYVIALHMIHGMG